MRPCLKTKPNKIYNNIINPKQNRVTIGDFTFWLLWDFTFAEGSPALSKGWAEWWGLGRGFQTEEGILRGGLVEGEDNIRYEVWRLTLGVNDWLGWYNQGRCRRLLEQVNQSMHEWQCLLVRGSYLELKCTTRITILHQKPRPPQNRDMALPISFPGQSQLLWHLLSKYLYPQVTMVVLYLIPCNRTVNSDTVAHKHHRLHMI